eukprot:GHVP01062440.1.p1 GENE.GHVP01062440.1~~GHVP01062440.1.p1  ORF type:complete len:173 (+),score=35.99 GHVP01062440.1:23-541(+)
MTFDNNIVYYLQKLFEIHEETSIEFFQHKNAKPTKPSKAAGIQVPHGSRGTVLKANGHKPSKSLKSAGHKPSKSGRLLDVKPIKTKSAKPRKPKAKIKNAAAPKEFQISGNDDFQMGNADDFQMGNADDFQMGNADDFQMGNVDDFQMGNVDDFQIAIGPSEGIQRNFPAHQ